MVWPGVSSTRASELADGDLVSLADGYVEPVQPRRVLARADHEQPRERRAQGRDSLHMIEVMMGQQHMGQPPAEALGFAGE